MKSYGCRDTLRSCLWRTGLYVSVIVGVITLIVALIHGWMRLRQG